MAERTGGDAFEVLGRIEVDLAALDKSLDQAKGIVTKRVGEIRTVMETAVPPGSVVASSRLGQPALPPVVPPTDSAKMTSLEFSHLTRIIRDLIGGPLSQLSPELDQVTAALARAARGARFYGVAIGAGILVSVALTTVVGKYMAAAKEATAATLDSAQALAMIDSARADAGMKRITEAMAEYNLQVDIATEKTSGGFWQKLVAWSAIAAEAVTGNLDTQIGRLEEYAAAVHKIEQAVGIPRARAEYDTAAASVRTRRGQLAVTTAADETGVAAGYSAQAKAVQDAGTAKLRLIALEKDEKLAVLDNMREQAKKLVLNQAEDKRRTAMLGIEEMTRTAPGYAESAEGKRRLAEVEVAYAKDVERASKLSAQFDTLAADIIVKNNLKIMESEETTSVAYAEAKEKMRAALVRLKGEIHGYISAQDALTRADKQYQAQLESARQAHAVRMGRVSMQDETAFQRAAASDPRRSKAEQEQAEQSLLETRKNYADEYFKYYEALGQDAGVKAVDVAKQFLSEMVEGSKSWFDQVSKISDIYTKMRDQAVAIASQMASVAGEEQARAQKYLDVLDRQNESAAVAAAAAAKRTEQLEKQNAAARASLEMANAADRALIAREGKAEKPLTRTEQVAAARKRIAGREAEAAAAQRERQQAFDKETSEALAALQMAKQRETDAQKRGQVSVDQLPALMARARERDEALLRGAATGAPGEISGALGRQGFWKTIDRERLSPREAFARATADPQQQLATALAGAGTTTTGFTKVVGESANALSSLIDAANSAAAALAKVGGADRAAARTAESARGTAIAGPWNSNALSDENRAAIAGAVSGQLTAESLSVYGRR